jgi:hypothetical protein
MSKPRVFEPLAHTSIAVTTASAEVTGLADRHEQVRLYNAGSVPVFVRWASTAQTAVTTDLALAPGAVELFSKSFATRMAAITASGSATLYITTGIGE